MRECFSPQLTPERLDMLSHDAAGWCIKPRREQQGTRAIVLTAELRIGTALLKKDGRHFKGILCQELLRAERPRREQQYVEAGREDVRDKRRIHQWLSRREVANQGIPVPTHCHKRTDSGLDALREWQHDAPVVRRLDASASVDIFSSVPAQVSVSNNMQESLADVRAISSCCREDRLWAIRPPCPGACLAAETGRRWRRQVINQQATNKLGQLLRQQRLAHTKRELRPGAA